MAERPLGYTSILHTVMVLMSNVIKKKNTHRKVYCLYMSKPSRNHVKSLLAFLSRAEGFALFLLIREPSTNSGLLRVESG